MQPGAGRYVGTFVGTFWSGGGHNSETVVIFSLLWEVLLASVTAVELGP